MTEQCTQRPVQNSEVYVLRQGPPPPFATVAPPSPPSPPSPITPAEDDFSATIEALSLNQPAIAAACSKKLAVEELLSRAVHVLATETAALQNLTQLYATDRLAREAFSRAVNAIVRRQGQAQAQAQPIDHSRTTPTPTTTTSSSAARPDPAPGKLVLIGVGKSGHIARKLVATFNSLALPAVFLHPTEALHGDLGVLSPPHDTVLLVTFSGSTPELLALLPHLDRALPLVLLTSHTRPETCALARRRPDAILLPAPVPEPETATFGVAAPTTSTTVALAVGDALALVAAREVHHGAGGVAGVFARNHPGGAIGAALRRQAPRGEVRRLAVRVDDDVDGNAALRQVGTLALGDGSGDREGGGWAAAREMMVVGADVLRAAYASRSGWVRLPDGGVISPRRIRRLGRDDMSRPLAELRWLATPRRRFIPVAADTSVHRAAEWIKGLRAATTAAGGESGGEGAYGDDAIVAVMDRGECVGLLEVGRLLEEA